MKPFTILITGLVLLVLVLSACGGVSERKIYEVTIDDGKNVEIYYGDNYYYNNKRRTNVVTISVYMNTNLVIKKSGEGLKMEIREKRKE